MANILSHLWLASSTLFDPVQYFFNGAFWPEFLRRLESDSRGRVVDLACGTGELRRHIQPKSYLGIDINPGYIKLATKNLARASTTFMVGDILSLPVGGKPDAVFFISAAHHLSDSQISTLARLLKKSRVKRFILVDGYPIGVFSKALAFLDDKLGGGKYFRNNQELVALFQTHLKIVTSGEFSARGSFYRYPFLVATAIKP